MRAGGKPSVVLVALAFGAFPASAQDLPHLTIGREDGSTSQVEISTVRGFTAVPLEVFQTLGWRVAEVQQDIAITGPDGISLTLRVGTPFLRWDGQVVQLADAPYREVRTTWVPLQLVSDLLPRFVPELYDFDGPRMTLLAGEVGRGADDTPAPVGERVTSVEQPTADTAPSTYQGPRLVIIDAGHGGSDPGAIGPSGVREKDIALGVARSLAAVLSKDPNVEVHMIRADDSFVPLWNRGQEATDIKAERPGVFISIHVNSLARRTVRGFETYFLAEARTEHERRVAAIENAPLSLAAQGGDVAFEPDLDFILRELRNLDHQHWSALLAEMVQYEMGGFHPGPNRGVKQGVLAVLTNALMPAVLVEVGFVSNAEESRVLATPAFHDSTASAIARAIDRFFERYPPGSANGTAARAGSGTGNRRGGGSGSGSRSPGDGA